jgi:aminoglycoside/choline kinase family phosphotransferase
MLPENLIEQTVSRFPRYAAAKIRVDELEKGGSDRKYYRIRVTEGHSLILVRYGEGREENRYYCAIAEFLAGLGIHVPEIYHHDEQERLIWMEDLGETDLWACRNAGWEHLRVYYGLTLDEMAALHLHGHQALGEAGLKLQAEFNEDLYAWEQNYFFENCAGRVFGRHTGPGGPETDAGSLREIARGLAAKPRVLVHRDFQSQNVLIDRGEAWLIDFQGLRPGLPQYDLASLVYDPYMRLGSDEREELVDAYIAKVLDAGGEIASDFRETLDLCAMQRLMQALGAYGFLGLVRERPAFLEHIPAALNSLREVLERIPSLAATHELVCELA